MGAIDPQHKKNTKNYSQHGMGITRLLGHCNVSVSCKATGIVDRNLSWGVARQ